MFEVNLLIKLIFVVRFAVVVFGGEGVFDQPRSLMAGNEIFSSQKQITQLFNQLPIGKLKETNLLLRYVNRVTVIY